MTRDDLLRQDFVDEMTDVAVTPLIRALLVGVLEPASNIERARVADLIDMSCVYVRSNKSTALLPGTPCGLEDWHALAHEIRTRRP